MEKIFSDFKKTFKRTVNTVTKKTGKFMEISKLTLAISGLNSDIKDEYEKIGEAIYKGYKKNDVPSQDVTAHCELIDAKITEIERLREKLSVLKDVRVCPLCKAEISKESTFCAKCGERL